MATHLEERQELDDLRYFWKNQGHWPFTLLVAVTLGYLNYIICKDHKIGQNREAAEVLAQMVDKTQSKADSKQINTGLLKLQRDYSDTVPAAQATMMVTATEFDTGRYDTAVGYLSQVLLNQRTPLIQALTAQRLTVVLLRQKRYDVAITVLNTKVGADFKSLLLEAKSDVYTAQSKIKEATQSYQQALEKLSKDAVECELLQVKLDSQK